MVRKPVKSSSIVSVGYDMENQILELEFHNGGIYQYLGVSSEEYEAFSAAESLGRYFAYNIREFYDFVKII